MEIGGKSRVADTHKLWVRKEDPMNEQKKKHGWDLWRLPIIGLQILLLAVLWVKSRPKERKD